MEFDVLKKAIVEVSGVDENEIRPETSFEKDLGLDSLDRYQIFLETTEGLGINKEADPDALSRIVTVQDALDLIKSLK